MDNLTTVLNILKDQRGFDFSGYRTPMLERRVKKRLYATNTNTLDEYINYLEDNTSELDLLIDVFTINVSSFFRNPLIFEHINKLIIPELIITKVNENNDSMRIWSAGCSSGEEPYSLAIIINEFLTKEESTIKLNIFGTDIDRKALDCATEGSYDLESIKKVKLGIFKKYFSNKDGLFSINEEIKKMVQFSFFDLLDKKSVVPPESIFGGFDIVLCRNVLIYFDQKYQNIIFNKLYRSLNPNGYLILGESEVPIEAYKHKFRRENKCCKIYRKTG